MKWLFVLAALLPTLAGAADGSDRAVAAALAALEKRSGGRLGVAVRAASGELLAGHRAEERFALCSTFKLLLAAVVLERVDAGREQLTREISYGAADLLEYAPATRENLGRGAMSVEALCAAAVELSDNSAANLLLATIGGPDGFTAAVRAWGDEVTRLDRNEPALNEVAAGDPRDTTTPAAMSATLARLLGGDVLTPASRDRLRGWMGASPTGRARLRAGFPAEWVAGDKTGTGPDGEANDVAFLQARGAEPILVAAYFKNPAGDAAARNAVLAEVGRLVAKLAAPAPR